MSSDARYKLTDEQKVSLEQFRSNVEDMLNSTHDDRFLLKWLKARKFDLPKAEKSLREHFKFRKKIGFDTILADHEIPEVVRKFAAVKHIGFDKEGNGVIVFVCGRTDMKGISYSLTLLEHIKVAFHFMEELLLSMKKENEPSGRERKRIVNIIDCRGLKMQQFLDKHVARRNLDIINAFQVNYSDVLKCNYVVNAPHFFKVWFNFAKTLFEGDLVKKFKVYDTSGWKEDLLEIIDADVLPAFLGGNITDPDGNLECYTMFGPAQKVPLSYYVTSRRSQVANDPTMKKMAIRERTYFNLRVPVDCDNYVIRWCFKTLHHDIRFGLYFVPEGIKPMPEFSLTKLSKSFRYRARRNSREGHELLIPLERIESHVFPEEGEYHCEKTGNYLLHFDNTYSWMTPKELYYKVEVVPATNTLSSDVE